MSILAAGPNQLDDWIQIIVILLVVGGSVFGSISKKLIKMFTPEESDEEARKRKTERAQRSWPPGRSRPLRPVPPVARPMPRAAGSGPTTAAPAFPPTPPLRSDQRSPLRPHAEPIRKPPAPPAPVPRPVTGRVSPARRRAKPPVGRRTPTVERNVESFEALGADVRESRTRFESALEERFGDLEAKMEEKSRKLDADVDERLGHLELEAMIPLDQAALGREQIPLIGRLTPSTLRTAVLMREILGPPVALRPDDDRF